MSTAKIRSAGQGCKPWRVSAVIQQVAGEFGLQPHQLIGPIYAKSKETTRREARDLAMWHVRGLRFVSGHPSYPQIGRWFGMDHGTAYRAIQRISDETCLRPEDVQISVNSLAKPLAPVAKRESMAA